MKHLKKNSNNKKIIEIDETKKILCEEHGIKIFYITKKNYSLNDFLKYINEASNKKE